MRFHNLQGEESRTRADQSFLVEKKEIVENDYDLSINRYKKTERVAEEYPSTQELMESLRELEKEIAAGLSELEGLLWE